MASFALTDAEFVAQMRRRDARDGLVQPWLTHGALAVIEQWDLVGKRVLEWGAGLSTIWWAARVGSTGRVRAVEHAAAGPEWLARVATALETTPWADCVGAGEPNGGLGDYAKIHHVQWDIFIVDGTPCHLRTDCIRAVLNVARPFTLVVDNWQQDHVYIDEAAAAMMAPLAEYGRFFVQPDHHDHNGRPWQTAIWELS